MGVLRLGQDDAEDTNSGNGKSNDNRNGQCGDLSTSLRSGRDDRVFAALWSR